MTNPSGTVEHNISNNIGRIVFTHPKANSLPLDVLNKIAATIRELDQNPQVKVMILASAGEGSFCGGASFEDLKQVSTLEQGEAFFNGFATVLLALRNAKKFIIGRVQGKAVGGGVGLVAGCDYVFALNQAAVRLSEFELGIGPFTVAPAIERKIGKAGLQAMSIDTAWRNSAWCLERGLFTDLADSAQVMDSRIGDLAEALSVRGSAATAAMRKVLWEGTENWDQLLPARAVVSAELWLASKKQTKR